MIKPNFNKGDSCKAFDGSAWMKTGDIGDNSQFWLNATIIDIRLTKDLEWVADVLLSAGRISEGHYLSSLKKL